MIERPRELDEEVAKEKRQIVEEGFGELWEQSWRGVGWCLGGGSRGLGTYCSHLISAETRAGHHGFKGKQTKTSSKQCEVVAVEPPGGGSTGTEWCR